MGKETGKIRLKDLAWCGFILERVRHLKGNRGQCAHCCCLPLPCFCLRLGSGEGGWGLLFSVRFIVTGFFIVVLKFFILLLLLGFISLSGLLLFLPTLSDSLPPRWGEEPVKPSQVVYMIAGNQ